MQKTFKKCAMDRYDGWRIKAKDPIVGLESYILRTRLDSQVQFDNTVPVNHLDWFVREHSKEIPGISLMTVIMAAMVRTYALRPHLNRFVVYNKLYAHNSIQITLTIKKTMGDGGEETLIKPEFAPTDTLADVVRRIDEELAANKSEDAENGTDKTAATLAALPAFIKRPAVNLLFRLDRHGLLPKALAKISPWHTSAFVTNMGSLGIDAIYHHLYEFGTCSQFLAMGKKNRTVKLNEDGSKAIEKSIDVKMVCDERVCDGSYYAISMRLFRKLLMNPEVLLEPPAEVVLDDEVQSPRL